MSEFLAGLRNQSRGLHALMIRELMMRYGRGNIGFLWLVLEPMILCAGVISVRWVIQTHEERGVPLVTLVLSGYMPLTLWRHLTNKSIHILKSNMGLLYHRAISVLDIFMMFMALEFIGCTFAYIVNYFALLVIGVIDPIKDYGYVIEGWCLMGILAVGFGALIAVLTEQYEPADRFIAPIQYLLLPVSGFLYMADWLPESVRKIALWIPLLHCFEIGRHGFLGGTIPTHGVAVYPLVIGLAFLGIYLPKFEKVRDVIPFG